MSPHPLTQTGQHERLTRTCRTAGSWFRRAAAISRATALPSIKDDEGYPWNLVGYEVGRMLRVVLGEAESLVSLLNDSDDEAEELERYAKDLARMLRNRRLRLAMLDDSGRTDAEKESFAAARERLRG